MKKDLISMNDLTLAELEDFLALAERVESTPHQEKTSILAGRVLMVMFYEPSTRTRLSFESAMSRLGGSVIGFSEAESTSVAKGESLIDTIHTVEKYSDVIVIRHPMEGTARIAAETSTLPVINAGDGTNQHPTQTLLDLYTIRKFFGRIADLKIAFVGDLKYSRTVHSLLQALIKFGNRSFVLVSPEGLRLPDYLKELDDGGSIAFEETPDLGYAIETCDVVYVTRIQRERFPDILEYEKVKGSYCVDRRILANAKSGMRILHPLPRVDEIAPEVDDTEYAGYFEQVENGVIMRQAILLHLLGGQL
jgi:aspartate carbamoyltransferase catalytic subunit